MYNVPNSNIRINSNLVDSWLKFCDECFLVTSQKLGCAYHSSFIATTNVLSTNNWDDFEPFGDVIPKIGTSSLEGCLPIYLEYQWLACNWNDKIVPVEFEEISDYYNQDNNPYTEYFQSEFGFFLECRTAFLLVSRIGQILEHLNVDIPVAFQIGHSHALALFYGEFSLDSTKVIKEANHFPVYLESIINYIPDKLFFSEYKDFWILSKIFYKVISFEFKEDSIFCNWLWNLHFVIFYEIKTGSKELGSEWSLKDPDFESNMLKKIMSTTKMFFNFNSNIGSLKLYENINITKWEEFFPILNERVYTNYQVKSPNNYFVNIGEFCNYLSYKFIESVHIILSNKQ
jgi:hypothetical protein